MTGATTAVKRKRGRPRIDRSLVDGEASSGTELAVGKEALVGLTLELLQQVAPAEITRAGLARHAEVDPSLIRYYFKDRASLLRTVAEQMTARLQERGAVATEQPDTPPADRICGRATALLTFKAANPFYHRLMIEEMAKSDSPESRDMFRSVARRAIERYRSYLDDGVAQGTLRRVDPGFLYLAIVGLCDFFVIAGPLLADMLGDQSSEASQADYAEFMCDLLMNGLRAKP